MKVKEGINRNGNGSKRKVYVGRAIFELLFLQEHVRDMQELTVTERSTNSTDENTFLRKVVTVVGNRDKSARGETGKW